MANVERRLGRNSTRFRASAWSQTPIFLNPACVFLDSIFSCSLVAESQPSAYLSSMAKELMPLAGLCALYLGCAACSAQPEPGSSSAAGASAAGEGGAAAQSAAGKPGASAGTASGAGASASGGSAAAGGTVASAGSAPNPSAGASGDVPPAIDGRSVYALECHGDSKDCNLAAVPCFGVSSQTPNVAAGWSCANRCSSDANCSDAPSGAEARASCVPFTSASHCMLVCKNENQSFACPDGMLCHVPPKSPIGYCLWP